MSDLLETIEDRAGSYGSYPEQCRISQNIKAAMADSPNWSDLKPEQRDALEMIAVKASRILNGNPDYADNWHDIAGYATLVERELK